MKWLANELAATAGELERIDEELTRLQARKTRLLGVHAALSDVAGLLTVPKLPAVVPAVRAHGKFGPRGGLRTFMREVLRKAQPLGVSTAALADLVIEAFELPIAGPKERKRLIDNTIRSTLTKLYRRGEVEPLHDQHGEAGGRMVASFGVWRWRVDAPSLEQLRAAAVELQPALVPAGRVVVAPMNKEA